MELKKNFFFATLVKEETQIHTKKQRELSDFYRKYEVNQYSNLSHDFVISLTKTEKLDLNSKKHTSLLDTMELLN